MDQVRASSHAASRLLRLNLFPRAIHYTSTVYKTPRCLIEPFIRLNSLRIDLPTTHETDQGDFDFASPELAQIIRESIPANAVQHLEIRGITWLDPFVMRHIADGVPNLRTLRLMQPFVWCGLCNTIGAPSFETIPARMIYADGAGLPVRAIHGVPSLPCLTACCTYIRMGTPDPSRL